MAFVNGGVLVISFALLLIVLSYSVSNINSVAVFANAKSVASALGTRLISSPNCFAYQLNINYYQNNSGLVGGPLYSVVDTAPGVIDVNKFLANNFIACAQYVYIGGATDVPALPASVATFTGITATLTDTQNPSDLSQSGSLSISNNEQLNYGSKFYGLENLVSQYATNAEYVALGASIAASIALGIFTGGTIGLNVVVAVASNNVNSIIPQYSTLELLASEDSYTESFPVEIQFTDSNGRPLYQDGGVLSVTINYGLSGYG